MFNRPQSVQLINVTDHTIDIADEDRQIVMTLPPSGIVTRVVEKTEILPSLSKLTGVPVSAVQECELTGVPPEKANVYYVSSLIAKIEARKRGRIDFLSPGDTVYPKAGRPYCIGLRL